MSTLEKMRNQSILVLGFGREGRSTLEFLRKRFPQAVIGIADQDTIKLGALDTRSSSGPNYLDSINDYDVVVKTPGISPHQPQIEQAKKSGKLITSQTQIFLEQTRDKVIGVTGTKGKSTTSSLIYHVLQYNAVPVRLLGNIGKPCLDFLHNDHEGLEYVFEMSSYQLMDLTISPHIAVLQAIYPDHLDYHQEFDEYRNAKLNITRYQEPQDYLICHISHKDLPTRAKKIIFSEADFDPAIKTKLLGKHNRLNTIPAVIVGKLLGLSQEQIYSAISSFEPLETRLQDVGTFREVTFYEDTLSTIPEAAVAAIEAVGPSTLIAGGHERKQNYSHLAQTILDSGIKTLILFPTTGPRIWREIKAVNPNSEVAHFEVNSMEEAIKLAYKHTPAGKTCLLSPAAPSFTLFKDYRDEGEQYRKYIKLFSSSSS